MEVFAEESAPILEGMNSGPEERDDKWPHGQERLESKQVLITKSPRWQAKEMRLGPEGCGGILSKQMTGLDFIFYKSHSGCSVENVSEDGKTGLWET